MKKIAVAALFFLLVLPTAALAVSADSNELIRGAWTFEPGLMLGKTGETVWSQNLSITDAFLIGTGVIGNDGTTAPGVATTDEIPKLVWETTEHGVTQWSFQLPSWFNNSVHRLVFRVVATCSDESTPPELLWNLRINKNGVALDTTEVAQTAEYYADCQHEPRVLELSPNDTARRQLQPNAEVTVDLANGDGGGTLEISSINVRLEM